MFTKILIANRGEIAIRIIRACKEMGISTVAVYSEADRESLHVALADEAICIGGPRADDSYLNGERIVSAALATHAQAIHPGYGFLSENAGFAALCKEHGVVFIGPPAEVISNMGDKDAARRLMKQNNVPTTPGTDILRNAQEAKEAAANIGYPVLIKASAGGGGKGIRLVEREEDMERAFETASSEAQKAFGDGRMYMEKYLDPVKHIEVQLLADEEGNIVCLGERECSIQRNNQKLIEESPANTLTPETRKEMIEVAIRAAKAAKYTSVGTIEFLMDKDGKFYFMEMNTRLQVEHSVTEMVTNIASAVTTFIFNIILMRLAGANGVAAITVLLYAHFLFSSAYMGFTNGVAPIFSYNYGAGNYADLKKLFAMCIRILLAAGVVIFAISQLAAGWTMRIFVGNNTALYEMSLSGFRLFAVCFLVNGINIFASGYLTALGNGRDSAVVSILRTLIVEVIAIVGLAYLFGINGVWMAIPVAEFVCLFVSVYMFHKNKIHI